MKTFTYSTTINKPVADVYEVVLDKSAYPEWAKAWGEGMTYEGIWEAGEKINFFDTSEHGTQVIVEEVIPNTCVKMKHIAMIEDRGQTVTKLDETMQKWIGTQEDYFFTADSETVTTFTVVITGDKMFEEMMNAWTEALQYLKEFCEAK